MTKRSPALLALVLSFSSALPHDREWLPFLAEGGPSVASTTLGARPRQPAGETLPLHPSRRIEFETDEGTWLSVDVSPDDRRIVFDLLGDLYSLDATGGRAEPIARGMAFDTQPTYSPDGQWIAFVSDRSGAENIWIARAAGTEARQISFGKDDSVLVSPAWSPDGHSIYVSRFLWSVNHYELWRYDLDGEETLVVPVKAADQSRDQSVSSLGAVVSPDGRHLYFARRTGDEKAAGVPTWTIVRRDVNTGQEQTIVPESAGPGRRPFPGTYFRPVLSPDGRLLAYATRFLGETGLRLRDLRTGEDRWLAFPIEHDQLFAQSWQDLVPRYAFTRDGKTIILSRNGKLERLPLAGGAAAAIPFTAPVRQDLGALTRVEIRQDTGPVRARLMQTPEQSPDGKRVAFSALGRVYVMNLARGAESRTVTQGQAPEFHPSWSPDGRSITFVTWSAHGAGHVWIAPADGGEPRRISDKAAFYTRPVFMPDGSAVLAVRSNQSGRLQTSMDIGQVRDAELILIPREGGEPRVIATGNFGSKPHFGSTPGVVYLRDATRLVAVDLATGEVKPDQLVHGPGWYFIDGSTPVDDSRISPDGRWVLAQVAQQLHVVAAGPHERMIDLSRPDAQHRRITEVGADFFDWANGGKTITWSVGSTFYRRRLADIALNAADAPGWSADVPIPRKNAEAFEAVVTLPRDVASGSVLLSGARIVTMRGEEVLEQGDILIRSGRIVAVGARGTLGPARDVEVRDVSGMTILPGFIDIHDHVADIRRDVLSTQSWGLRARLAYGITTAFDPSSLSIDMFAYQDMLDAGITTGARLGTTGTAMFSFNRPASLKEAGALLSRYRDHYRTRNVKQYLIGNRTQRQWLAAAAAEMGVMPTTEGSLALKMDLTQIIDGFAGSEHALPTPLYKDVIELVARSGTAYDLTLQIDNGGPAVQDNFVIRDRPLLDEKFLRFRPYSVAANTALSRPWTEPSTMLYRRIASDAARIQRAGGVVGIGSHGDIPGPGFHWEMEAHVHGGMTPWEALRAGTMGSATAIGRGRELGSIEPGKIADLVIFRTDPRADIRDSRDIAQVMKAGRLYDADTLEELWPRRKPLDPPWFADERPVKR